MLEKRRIPQQFLQTHIYSDANAPEGMNEYEFTAATDSIRLRLKRKDHNHQGALSFYVDRAVLRIIRDTLNQDTVYLATGNNYKYAFNGMERDDELNGVGNSYDFGVRIYDASIGRWLTVDPMTSLVSNWSTYRAFYCNPIHYNDFTGMLESTEVTLNDDGSYTVVEAKNNGDNYIYVVDQDGKPVITMLRVIGDMTFGNNMRNTEPYLLGTPIWNYNQVMPEVGSHNQEKAGDNGFNSGFPYLGAFNFYGYFGCFYK